MDARRSSTHWMGATKALSSFCSNKARTQINTAKGQNLHWLLPRNRDKKQLYKIYSQTAPTSPTVQRMARDPHWLSHRSGTTFTWCVCFLTQVSTPEETTGPFIGIVIFHIKRFYVSFSNTVQTPTALASRFGHRGDGSIPRASYRRYDKH